MLSNTYYIFENQIHFAEKMNEPFTGCYIFYFKFNKSFPYITVKFQDKNYYDTSFKNIRRKLHISYSLNKVSG